MTLESESGLTMTERAAKRVLRLLATEPQGSLLRVSVNGGGCSGFSYAFALDAGPEADDVLVERDGARMAVDPVSLAYLGGSVVDFVDDLMGQSFRIANPNAVASCGCGTSFTI